MEQPGRGWRPVFFGAIRVVKHHENEKA